MSKSYIILVFCCVFFVKVSAQDKLWNESVVQFENCSITLSSGANTIQPTLVNYDVIENYTTIALDLDTGARCLDGTPYKFFFTRGNSTGINKWIIYFQGASYCGSEGEEVLESCYDRLSTLYGTSDATYWGENGTIFNWTVPMGWFSSMEEYNPLFANYNKVQLISCDGSNFLSSFDDPLYYNDTALYFRGMNNTLATLEYLDRLYGLMDAEEIIISGGSSGGTAAWIWMPYFQNYFKPSINLWLLSDAGLFIDTYNEYSNCYFFRFCMQALTTALAMGSGPTYSILKYCRYSSSNETLWKCLMPEYVYEDINVPAFVFNSQNDFKQVIYSGGIDCINNGGLTYCDLEDRIKIQKIREAFLDVVMEMKEKRPQWGFWLRTCFEHTYHFTWAWYGHEMDVFSAELQTASNARDALYQWYFNMNETRMAPSFIDLVDWLHNPLCKYGANQYDENAETTTPNGYIISSDYYSGNY